MSARDGWQRVKFGDVVRNVSERVSDPVSFGLDRAVGLEHLEPGELELTRWASTSEGLTFTRRFRSGQVLFGRRRAYQRKAAIADFDGVCSGDIYVLEPSSAQLIAAALPFIVQSEPFYRYALRTSAGSLSPRTKWTDLKNYEFDLPPVDEQREIADILAAADLLRLRYRRAREGVVATRRRVLMTTFLALRTSSRSFRIGELGEVQLGRQRAPKYTIGKCPRPYLRVVNVIDGELDLRDVQEMDFDERDFSRYSLRPDDVLVTEGDITSPFNVGRSAVFRGEIDECCFQNTLIRFRAGETILAGFAHAAFQDALYRGVFAAAASTTTVTHLGAQRFANVKICAPSLPDQRTLMSDLKAFDRAAIALRAQEKRAASMKAALLTELLEPREFH